MQMQNTTSIGSPRDRAAEEPSSLTNPQLQFARVLGRILAEKYIQESEQDSGRSGQIAESQGPDTAA